VTGRQAPPLHLRRGSGSGAIFQRATHKFCGRGRISLLMDGTNWGRATLS